MSPKATMLPDGRRLHLQHGPTDLIIDASGPRDEIAAAYRQAIERFRTLLVELVGELPGLRRPAGADISEDDFRWPTARRMARAVHPYADTFITPMAAVAGAVSDEILAALVSGRRLTRAHVNNGGDIALYLAPGKTYSVGLVSSADRPEPGGRCGINHDMPVRGVATSGRGGRSFSLGIADAVTVLAGDAASADAAATLIANAVNIDHPEIRRVPAETLDPDSDLGKLPVTMSVGPLDETAVAAALDNGAAVASRMQAKKLIYGTALCLNEQYRVVGPNLSSALPAATRPRQAVRAQAGGAGR